MTDPTPDPLAPASGAPAGPPAGPPARSRSRRPRRWAWPAATGALALLGVAALGAAALAAERSPGTADAGTSTTGAPSAAASSGAASSTSASSGAAGRTAPSATATGTATGAAAGTAAGTATGSATVAVADTPIAELADAQWLARTAAATGIPERALAAYAGAAIAVADSDPGCGLGWNTLAAIGSVESGHGSTGGATLGADGTATPAIIGVALDGSDGVAAVADTDGGVLDGDTTWDHAVGPFQFLPATWALTAQDGDRDGTADIGQIDDAALAAAVHLCDVGGDLTVAENWIAAISAYNDSVAYNNQVAAAAEDYATVS